MSLQNLRHAHRAPYCHPIDHLSLTQSEGNFEHEPETEEHYQPDNFEFARGAMIAVPIGVAIWAVIFLIVKLVFS